MVISFYKEEEMLAEEQKKMLEEFQRLQAEFLEAQFQYDKAKTNLEHYRRMVIPNLFMSEGIEELRTTNGVIRVKDEYHLHPNKNPTDTEIMGSWLREHGADHLVIEDLKVGIASKPDLDAAGIPNVLLTTLKDTQSVKSWIRKQFEAGAIRQDDIPKPFQFTVEQVAEFIPSSVEAVVPREEIKF